MTESASAFDRESFEVEAVSAFAQRDLLDWLCENSFTPIHDQYGEVCSALVGLHNRSEIDLLAPVLSGVPIGGAKRDFWLLQDLFCKVIPELKVDVDALIATINRLVDEAGNDGMANRPNAAFREWLKRRPQETEQLLNRLLSAAEDEIDMLTFVLEAGAIQDLAKYYAVSIKLLSDGRMRARLSAATALGRIDASGAGACHTTGLVALSEYVRSTTSAHEAATAIAAFLDAYARNPEAKLERALETIRTVAKLPSPDLHYNLASALSQHHPVFESDLQLAIIDALSQTDPAMNGVVDQIDFAFAQCLNEKNRQTIAICLQTLLDHPDKPLQLRVLDSFVHQLVTEKTDSLNWLVVYWLRFGSHNARLSLPSLFRLSSDEGYELHLNLTDFDFHDEELVFISRKALGYFLIESATAASILIACLRATQDNKAAQTIADLIFDPLMINFPGQVRSIVEREAKPKAPRQKQLKAALNSHAQYTKGLQSVPKIPELSPSPTQRQVQAERQRKQFAQSFREAEASSVFLNLVTRQTLLHGSGSITYMRDINGELRRTESMLSSHGTSIEVPRFEIVDPISFQHMILEFRREALNP